MPRPTARELELLNLIEAHQALIELLKKQIVQLTKALAEESQETDNREWTPMRPALGEWIPIK